VSRFLLSILLGVALSVALILTPRMRAPLHGIADQKSSEEETEEAPSDWFMAQRIGPTGVLNHTAVEQARAQAATLRRGVHALDEPWVFAGPSNVGGRITALAAHPSAPQTIYAGAAVGGVFKSTDGGLNFTNIFQADYALSTGALAIDPSNPQRIWLGTGEANASGDSYEGNGVYLSQDGGQSWTHKGLDSTRTIGRIVVDPTDSNRVFVAAAGELFGTNPQRGLYRTTDMGNTWQRVLFVTDSTGCIDVALRPGQPDTLYAVMWERLRRNNQRQAGGITSRVWRSNDGGGTWNVLAGGLPTGATTGRGGIAISASNPNRMYAIFANHPGSLLGIYRSNDAGATWTQIGNPGGTFYSTFGWYFGQIQVDPVNQDIVYVQGVNMFRSTNAGNAWNTVFGSAHVDHHALWIDRNTPAHLLTGHDGGVNISNNSGSTSTRFNDLPVTQFYAITSDPQLPQRLYGGTQDNSTPRTLTGAVNDWDVIFFGDGFYCLVDPRDSDVIYAESQNGGLGKSLDLGNTWFDITSGFGGDRINWCMPFAMDPHDPDVLYCGTYRIWRSQDGGFTWIALSGDLTSGPGGGNLIFGTITNLDISPVDSNVIYCGTDDSHVWVSTNRGGSWTDISGALPNRWCTRVTAHPDSASVVYVAFSGYKEVDYLPHLFRSGNYGATWTEIGQGLPEAPINDVIVDPLFPSYIYVGTDFGVFYSWDCGVNWSALGEGLPMSSVFDLQLTSARDLVAGTHGRSMWKYSLGSTPPSAPVGLVIHVNGGVLTLNWPPVTGATQYRVYGSAAAGTPGSLLTTVPTPVWTDPDFATRPSTFFYYVTAE
jgi:photosystem II stability/assembly factor-like uncharacterized protein